MLDQRERVLISALIALAAVLIAIVNAHTLFPGLMFYGIVIILVALIVVLIRWIGRSVGSPNGTVTLPQYWNERIIALERLRTLAQIQKTPTFWRIYLSELERNYQAALVEGREALAKRFLEHIERYGNRA